MKALQRFIASLQKSDPWSSAFVAVLISLSSIFIATAIRTTNWVLTGIVGVFLLLLVAVQIELVRTRNKLGQGLLERDKTIQAILVAASGTVKSVVGADKHLRVSLMLPSPSRQTRKVHYQVGFAENDTDKDLELSIELGNTGVAWRRRRPHYTDMLQAAEMLDNPDAGLIDYGLTPAQQRLVRPTLKSMLSVPIFDPDFPDHQLLGTLAFDSDNTLEEMHFKDAGMQLIAQNYAAILSRILRS